MKAPLSEFFCPDASSLPQSQSHKLGPRLREFEKGDRPNADAISYWGDKTQRVFLKTVLCLYLAQQQ